jgi:methylated-DNA-[protein]-cysteine S-methyltransferase
VRVEQATYEVPSWGVGELWTSNGRVLAHDFRFGADPASVSPDGGRCPTPAGLAERFIAFFRGEEVRFDDVALDLSWATPFQRAVADRLREVPRGEVVSYGELAALAGHPGAQRAVGTFCARNRFMLLVPCHRVVGAVGIGPYGSAGVSVKRRLLALEGVTL